MKLQVGQPAPNFTLPSHLDKLVTLSDLRGKNVVLAFFPRAWTPVCSGQIPSYEADKHKFALLDTLTLGISIDHVPSLKAWADSLGGISYPLLSDFWPHGKIAQQYGVLRSEGYSERAVFVIDKDGNICYVDVHDIDEQPSNEELRKVLRRIDPGAAEQEAMQAVPAKIDLPHGGVVVYCTPWCPDCRRAKMWMKSHNVPYTEVDIFSTPGAEEQVRQWNSGKLVTPTFDADGVILADFVEEAAVPILAKYKQ